MCLGIPMKLVEIKGDLGVVELGGIRRDVGLQLVEDLRLGDYLIVHAGFAISKVDEEEAEETIAMLREMEYLL